MADAQKPKTKEEILAETKALLKHLKEHPEDIQKFEALAKNGLPAKSQTIAAEGPRANNPHATPGSAGSSKMAKVGPSEAQSTPDVPAASQTIQAEGKRADNPHATPGSAGADPMGKMAKCECGQKPCVCKREMIKKELSSEFKPRFKKAK